jgi:hypothetical protein
MHSLMAPLWVVSCHFLTREFHNQNSSSKLCMSRTDMQQRPSAPSHWSKAFLFVQNTTLDATGLFPVISTLCIYTPMRRGWHCCPCPVNIYSSTDLPTSLSLYLIPSAMSNHIAFLEETFCWLLHIFGT